MQKLLNDLPPTLSDSQVKSVQKQLKLTLFGFLKHPSSVHLEPDQIQTIVKLLTQLGAKKQEIDKACPKQDETRRVKKRQQVYYLQHKFDLCKLKKITTVFCSSLGKFQFQCFKKS